MPRKSKEPLKNLSLKRARQISDAHCGPAVIQMLLANLGVEVTQEQVTEAAGAATTIDTHGTRVDQLAQAVRTLSPGAELWYKERSKMRELIALVKKYRYPVGVEWQGLFDDIDEVLKDDDTEDEEEDYGHYSVITHVDTRNRQLIIVDPYKEYAEQDRIFSFDVFRPRWWDTNEVTDPVTGKAELVEDDRMMFIVAPKEETFPLELEMRKY